MPTAELIEKVDAVGAEQVRGLAERLLTKSLLSFALVGAGSRTHHREHMAARSPPEASGVALAAHEAQYGERARWHPRRQRAAASVSAATGMAFLDPHSSKRQARSPWRRPVAAPAGDDRLRSLGARTSHQPRHARSLRAAVGVRRAEPLGLSRARSPVPARSPRRQRLCVLHFCATPTVPGRRASRSPTCVAASPRRPPSATGWASRTRARAHAARAGRRPPVRLRGSASASSRGGVHAAQSRLAARPRSQWLRARGLARRYLRINGLWQDHVLFALIARGLGRMSLRSTNGRDRWTLQALPAGAPCSCVLCSLLLAALFLAAGANLPASR